MIHLLRGLWSVNKYNDVIVAEGVSSYTATVLHAAKSLSKGLRGLGESVAHSLAGGRSTSQSPSPPNTDIQQPGVVTVLDIEVDRTHFPTIPLILIKVI